MPLIRKNLLSQGPEMLNYIQHLNKSFYQENPVASPSNTQLLFFNDDLAKTINASDKDIKSVSYLSGQSASKKNQSISLAYAGHQFGHFVPLLGDGRAHIIDQFKINDQTYDLQLKGSGPTPYSRGGDGLCPLGPALREYLISEALYYLNIPTTRSLSVVVTGDYVYREAKLPGAIVSRFAKNHIRIGTFEHFAHKDDFENLKLLTDFYINTYEGDLNKEDKKYKLLFERICQRLIQLVVDWQGIGFIHGVMNTDNMAISGETIDFGPCAFMNQYKANQVYSFIDKQGRYSYLNQGPIVLWNLSCFANALLKVIALDFSDEKTAIEYLQTYFDGLYEYYQNLYYQKMSQKLGVITYEEKHDKPLVDQFLQILTKNKLDFTHSFNQLKSLSFSDKEFESAWLDRLSQQNKSNDDVITLLKKYNPYFIPRNHVVDQALENAYQNNFDLFKKIYEHIKDPFRNIESPLTQAPKENEDIENTFCGT